MPTSAATLAFFRFAMTISFSMFLRTRERLQPARGDFAETVCVETVDSFTTTLLDPHESGRLEVAQMVPGGWPAASEPFDYFARRHLPTPEVQDIQDVTA